MSNITFSNTCYISIFYYKLEVWGKILRAVMITPFQNVVTRDTHILPKDIWKECRHSVALQETSTWHSDKLIRAQRHCPLIIICCHKHSSSLAERKVGGTYMRPHLYGAGYVLLLFSLLSPPIIIIQPRRSRLKCGCTQRRCLLTWN
jgi:hypothetical protein